MSEKRGGYQDMQVWQRAMDLSVAIYKLTEQFPADERFGLVSQMRRAAISIPSNIAEGYRRNGAQEKRYFLSIAFGSGSELETQMVLAKRLSMAERSMFTSAENLLEEVMKMLNVMTGKGTH